MTKLEKLEAANRILKSYISSIDEMFGVSEKDKELLDFMSEQAERVQILEEEREIYLKTADAMDKTNQRYKQVIEEIREYVNSEKFNDNCWDAYVINKMVDEALLTRG